MKLAGVIALLAPGQGAQTPGMLAPWLAAPGAQEVVARWSEAADLDLERLGTTADADEIVAAVQCYLAEYGTPAPDLGLRNLLRQKLIERLR